MNSSLLHRLTTAPNLLSLLRLILVPVLLGIAWAGDPHAFFWTLAVAFLTDLLDGPLARRLGLMTDLGARLDSIADVGVFGAALVGVVWFFPDVVRQYAILLVLAFLPCVAAQAVCFIRYRRPAGFHTWLAKATGLTVGIAILSLFWVQRGTWLMYVVCVMGVLAQTEQLAIALTLRSWQADMPSWWNVCRVQATVVGVFGHYSMQGQFDAEHTRDVVARQIVRDVRGGDRLTNK
ncbi:MAG: CDP-alcohol phosphatidyltransferase family protein [Bacillota bacterium]